LDYRKVIVVNIWKFPWILLILWSISLPTGHLSAQDQADVWLSSADYAFGQSVTFTLEGETAVSIQSITLIINTPTFSNPVSVQADEWESIDGVVKVSRSISSKALKLPPFSTAIYWWEVETENETFSIPARSFFYEDDRFDWLQVADDRLQVYWTGEDDLGRIGLQVLQENQARIDDFFETDDDFPVNLYIYPSSAELRAAFLLNDLDWAGDVTDLPSEVVMVTAVNPKTAVNDLQQAVPYALTKFWLKADTIPVWLREGVAREMTPGWVASGLVETAVSNETAIPFSDLCQRFPETKADANLATAQSAAFVTYLRTKYGDQAIQQLINAFADGANCNDGAVQALDKPLDSLNREWLKEYRSYPLLIQFVIDNSLWFLLILFVVFTGFLIWKI
jgi:hypothetical protein